MATRAYPCTWAQSWARAPQAPQAPAWASPPPPVRPRKPRTPSAEGNFNDRCIYIYIYVYIYIKQQLPNNYSKSSHIREANTARYTKNIL